MLDLRNVHHEFWGISSGTEDADFSAETVSKKQTPTHHHRDALRQPLKVVTHLHIDLDLQEYQTYFLQWAWKRRDSLHLCCRKMKIRVFYIETVRKVLKLIQSDCIEELEVNLNTVITLNKLLTFAPCLVWMKNLRKLFLREVNMRLFSKLISM